jgi:phosphohistidine swiveling domain-containing protein
MVVDSQTPAEGGKAFWLKKLAEAGYQVPQFFVVPFQVETHPEHLALLLKTHIKTPFVAVRSSASAEDGMHQSFAGQFLSKLQVPANPTDVAAAIEEVRASVSSDMVSAYQAQEGNTSPIVMHVVVQEMVQAVWAGVLFTADPVRQSMDRILLSMVEGEGEALVSGRAATFDVALSKWGATPYQPIHDIEWPKGFQPKWAEALANQAHGWERKHDCPMDFEWAIDAKGILWWLQSRPITTMTITHLNEWDTVCSSQSEREDWFTLGNIGEMMPGAVSPITAEVFGQAIDAGLKDFAQKSGVPVPAHQSRRYLQVFYYRLFFNLSALYDFTVHTALNEKENIDLSIVGRSVEAPAPQQKAGTWRRGLHFLQQVAYLQSAGGAVKRLERLASRYQPEWSQEPYSLWIQLDRARDILSTAFKYHFATSSQSGSYYAALVRVVSKGKTPDPVHHQKASAWLQDIGKVESADPLKQLEALAERIRSFPDQKNALLAATPEAGLVLMQKFAPVPLQNDFQFFIDSHGHRGVREAEFASMPWGRQPEKLIETLQLLVSLPKSDKNTQLKSVHIPWKIRPLIQVARKAVVRREKSKALSIKILDKIREGYGVLGQQLTAMGYLHDASDVFFYSMAELAEMAQKSAPLNWKERAPARRLRMEQAHQLRFDDVFQGKPFPLQSTSQINLDANQLAGIPVCPGVITGPVRLIHTREDAHLLKPGEIMIAPFTDIGWTPFYAVAAGLVTEIGSPLSHGAVVAREYGLPTIVSVAGAMQWLKTGDVVTLNGLEGTLTKL